MILSISAGENAWTSTLDCVSASFASFRSNLGLLTSIPDRSARSKISLAPLILADISSIRSRIFFGGRMTAIALTVTLRTGGFVADTEQFIIRSLNPVITVALYALPDLHQSKHGLVWARLK